MATRVVEVANGVPGLAAERAVTWPKRTKARLSNGLEVILAEAHSIPRFHGELFFRSGNAAAIHRAPGLAEMTATWCAPEHEARKPPDRRRSAAHRRGPLFQRRSRYQRNFVCWFVGILGTAAGIGE